MNGRLKNPALCLTGMAVVVTFTVLVLVPWIRRTDVQDPLLAWLAPLNAAIWWLVMWWSIHHLLFRLAPLIIQRATAPNPAHDSSSARFVILYPTRDDFQEAACQSCIQQDYSSERLRVVICDDSADESNRQRIDEFAARFPEVLVIRRTDRRGFKAGNLNHAITHAGGNADWIVIADSDQTLPLNYIQGIDAVVAGLPETVAYVQAGQTSDHELPKHSTHFQQALGGEINLFYTCDLAMRDTFGFLPLIGHGAAVRRTAWEETSFPEVVSEDFAMSMELRNRNRFGRYSGGLQSWESFPESFGAFLIRFRKFSGGTAELFRRHLPQFLVGPATFTEKLDMLMIVGWYALIPLVVLNTYLSAYVCHRLWQLRVAAIHPVLPYVFVLMFLLNVPAIYSVSPTLGHALRHWLWASAIYGASLPLAAIRFLKHLLGPRPTFERTPKNVGHSPIGYATSIGMLGLGILTLGVSWLWSSPFSPVLWALAVSYASFPLYGKLNEYSLLGNVARIVVLLPGVLYGYALWELWKWIGLS